MSRSLTLPSIAEADLEAALQLEIAACSPFASDDTVAGWRVTRGGDAGELVVDLAIASRSAVMTFLGQHFELMNPGAAEVWASAGGHWIAVKGFGEDRREADYLRRFVRVGCHRLLSPVGAGSGGDVAFLNGRELSGLELQRDEALKEAANAIAS